MLKKAFPWLYEVDPEPAEEGAVVQAGEKVVLREKRRSDIDDDYGWRVDEELSRLDATRPITMSYEAFRNYAREEMQYATSTSKRLAIDTLDGVHIGNCMYYDINRRRGVAELGIMIGDRRYWGAGYGTDAVRTLLDHIFTTTDLDSVYLHTLQVERPGAAVVRQGGLSRECARCSATGTTSCGWRLGVTSGRRAILNGTVRTGHRGFWVPCAGCWVLGTKTGDHKGRPYGGEACGLGVSPSPQPSPANGRGGYAKVSFRGNGGFSMSRCVEEASQDGAEGHA